MEPEPHARPERQARAWLKQRGRLGITYDLICVGGGIGGSSLACAMAAHGLRVLVVERTKSFTDRVRGESMHPWGVAEVQELGLWPVYQSAGARELEFWIRATAGTTVTRHLPSTTRPKLPEITFYHPTMQEALLRQAETRGADIWRGATVRQVAPGRTPSVAVERPEGRVEVEARLVVAADGRESAVRRWGGFEVSRDPDREMIAGLLCDGVDLDDGAAHNYRRPPVGPCIVFPQGEGRARAYFGYPCDSGHRLSGRGDTGRFFESCVQAGVAASAMARAVPNGPLASFNAADSWVDHPYRSGVALIGDAAASSDPNLGLGLSLTARDVRVLRDQLLSDADWDSAGHGYAVEHDRYYGGLRAWYRWSEELSAPQGPAADAWRAMVRNLGVREPNRVPDVVLSGPDVPMDEAARRRFFGEDVPEIAAARKAALAG